MLHIIRGRAGSGKTDYLHSLIKNCVKDDKFSPVLIVPEQFSFITERSLLKRMGARDIKKVTITSFSRLARSYYKDDKDSNPSGKPFADDGVRCVLMLKALETVKEDLTVYAEACKNTGVLDSLVSFEKELKLCKVSLSDIRHCAVKIGNNELLRSKLLELDEIFTAYDALLTQSYFDENELLKYFNDDVAAETFFDGKIVYVDAFRGFSRLELDCIRIAMRKAKDVYISFCTDGENNPDSAFGFIDDFENEIISAAENDGVEYDSYVINETGGFAEPIAFIEKNIYTDSDTQFKGDCSAVKIAECSDIDDECRFVACEIKKLLRNNNYRYKDIAVIERSDGVYKKYLCDMLTRYGIPVFNDYRRPLVSELVFIHLISALECTADHFQSESLFRYLKTTLSGLSLNEVSALEKYAVIWDINGRAWLEPFKQHPSGYGKAFSEADTKQLEYINKVREKAVAPLKKLIDNTTDKTGLEISKAVFDFLEETGVPDRLLDFAEKLSSEKMPVEAKRKEVSWEALVQLLETCAAVTSDEHISLKRWFTVFKIIAGKKDIGEIPQGLDEVTAGSADRIRTDGLKVVFLVGVNKNEFPLVCVKNGILSDRERQALVGAELGIRPPFADCVNEERFISYCALTAASEQLYLSYKTVSKENTECSTIITDIKKLIPEVEVIEWYKAEPMQKIESMDSAFSELARCFNKNSTLRETLYTFFKNNKEYSDKIRALERAAGNSPMHFESTQTATELFGENIRLSATQIDTFTKCPFSYFCRYGIKAEPLKKTEFDSSKSGTLIHQLLEELLKKYGPGFVDLDDGEIKANIDSVLNEYMNEKLGGLENKSKRFMYLYNHLAKTLMIVINRLKAEFAVCSFEPIGFEVKIGDKPDDDVPAYELPLENGGIKINGSVDRVDLYEKDGLRFIRVIDYKSGTKSFDLSKLLSGLDIQMVLYMMALMKNGTGKYADFLPAGVLYVPSKIGYGDYSDKRSPSDSEIAAKQIQLGKLSGIVLDNPVVFNAMGVDKIHNYLPVGYNKDGSSSGNYYSMKLFRNLSKRIDDNIIHIGERMHNGDIPVMPLGSSEGKFGDLQCKYCDYRSICGREDGEKFSVLESYGRFSNVKKILEEDSNE